MASTIGLKIANGEFYPILKENSQERKRLILTTVHDKQRSIQIDLYRSSSRTMTDAHYIGSLVMEKLKSQPKGQPSIELVIASSENGDINAHAVDLDGGTTGPQSLSVSLKTLDETKHDDYEIADSDLQDGLAAPNGLYEPPAGAMKKDKTWIPKLVSVAVILLILILAAWILFSLCGPQINLANIQALFQRPQAAEQTSPPAVSQQTPPAVQAPVPETPAQTAAPPATPPPVVQTPTPQETPPPAQAATPPPQTVTPPTQAAPASPPVIQAPAEPPPAVQVTRTRPPAPVASYNVPSVIPREGVVYRIRYGDTLWDISEAFYRNPWLYPRIARFNNIRNPDLIISGTTIRVPPRN